MLKQTAEIGYQRSMTKLRRMEIDRKEHVQDKFQVTSVNDAIVYYIYLSLI
jgi:hypothetical protein